MFFSTRSVIDLTYQQQQFHLLPRQRRWLRQEMTGLGDCVFPLLPAFAVPKAPLSLEMPAISTSSIFMETARFVFQYSEPEHETEPGLRCFRTSSAPLLGGGGGGGFVIYGAHKSAFFALFHEASRIATCLSL